MIINFCGQEFLLHPSGALYWPSEKMLIVSDLHLEKGSHFARRGFFLPPYDSLYTLSLLHKVCGELRCRALLLLGDSFHDKEGFFELGKNERALFDDLSLLCPIWIRGNHDYDCLPDKFISRDKYLLKSIIFRHEAIKGAKKEISGHFHPKAEISYGQSRPCFIEDGNKLIMPAFGSFTGGLNIKASVIQELLNPEYNVYALGKTRVYKIVQSCN